MPRILGVDIPNNKKIEFALRSIYGIGPKLSKEILDKTEISITTLAKDLTEAERGKINAILQSEYKIEGDLRREVSGSIKRLMSIQSYRGSRHKKGLPVRGQRTHTNARTRKGPRQSIGGRKKV